MYDELLLFGNTALKQYLVNESLQILREEQFLNKDLDSFFHNRPNRNTTYAASVVPALSQQYLDQLDSAVQVIDNADVPVINSTDFPDKTGIDRLLNAAAAHGLFPNDNAIIFDCGTALSVAVVTPQNIFLGGPILLGVHSELAALSSTTELLPHLSVFTPEPFEIASNTTAAIQSGVFWGKIGAIHELSRQILKKITAVNHAETHIIITGGWATPLSKQLEITHHLIPDLTVQGLIKTIKHLRDL